MMRIGEQIAYVPGYAKGDMEHDNVEYGFVVEGHKRIFGYVFCRYWKKDKEGERLRNTGNPELTPAKYLIAHISCPQEQVDKLIEEFKTEHDEQTAVK